MQKLATILSLMMVGASANAELNTEIGFEFRNFFENAQDVNQENGGASISIESEYYREWDNGNQSLIFTPFLRWDQQDNERSHFDLREAKWMWFGDGLEVQAGLAKDFWGVTEVYHLVDIVNQSDFLESPDGEKKLGQPMFKLSSESDGGVLDLYLLPYFVERTFPGSSGRLRSHPRVATELVQYEHGDGNNHIDIAGRWSQSFDDVDLGLSYFKGTNREPSLALGLDGQGNQVFIPTYKQLSQFGIDAQLIVDDMLWKLEVVKRSETNNNYIVSTGGLEYTFVGVNESSSDLGLLFEFMWDERNGGATSPFNRDVFLGLRWIENDEAGTEALVGIVQDVSGDGSSMSMEASRRLNEEWKLEVEARFWRDIPASAVGSGLIQDDYIELELIRYF